ncbi:glycerol-3-phosphate 1-O-acyltransferase PlsY [Desulfobulbus rhabdoformis]|uniref:glycerol-3-phosphate 1-O-acyltransferase PlsY n=1 Tax=Desulfobulbus rhabdoformis TaxID=34032 RepID=UPI0019650D18|nr:glycerol-3-phosphate 1-O-acyltransferase PlsY [Desulfobulbus rhabdoformis]MBM9613097.1 glycerol-3-phosphate 1-O-acyltransferase PlsY [Desulfobulbus rhabdoformis]
MNSIGILCIALSYLLGAVPFGLVLSRGSGIDIRNQGSKNIGATNVTRLLGKKLGALTLLCDLLKGFLPMFLTGLVLNETAGHELIIALCGAASVLGHMFPVYIGFKGGKGVATALGAFLYLAPLAVLGCLLVFIAAVYFSGFVSLGSLLGSLSMLLWLPLLHAPGWKMGLAAFIVLMIWVKHYQNIGRLIRGGEKSWKRKTEDRE